MHLVPLPSGSVSLLSFAGRGRAATEDRARAAVTQTAEFGYPPILPPCTPPHPETNFRFLQSASEAPITERRFSFPSIPLGQSIACEGNLRQGNGHPLRRPPPRTAPSRHAEQMEEARSQSTVPPLRSKSEAAVTRQEEGSRESHSPESGGACPALTRLLSRSLSALIPGAGSFPPRRDQE